MKIEDVQVVNLRFDYPGGTGFRYAGGRSRVGSPRSFSSRPTAAPRGIGAAYSHPDLVKVIVEQHLAPHLDRP